MDFELYRKKVRGCFLGKAIGGTLGMLDMVCVGFCEE